MAVFFTESSEDDEDGTNPNVPGFTKKSSGDCNTGTFGVIGLALAALISFRSRKE